MRSSVMAAQSYPKIDRNIQNIHGAQTRRRSQASVIEIYLTHNGSRSEYSMGIRWYSLSHPIPMANIETSFRALSELETSGQSQALHQMTKRPSGGEKYVDDGLSPRKRTDPQTSDSVSNFTSSGRPLVPLELEASPSGISVLSNLTDELLVVS